MTNLEKVYTDDELMAIRVLLASFEFHWGGYTLQELRTEIFRAFDEPEREILPLSGDSRRDG